MSLPSEAAIDRAFITAGKFCVVFGGVFVGTGLMGTAIKDLAKKKQNRPKIVATGGAGLVFWGASMLAMGVLWPAAKPSA